MTNTEQGGRVEEQQSADAAASPPQGVRPPKSRVFTIVFFAAAWPGFTVAIELVTGMSATDYLDPMPTWAHLALLLLVPIPAIYGVAATSREWDWDAGRARRAAFLCGAGLGVAGVYSLLYAPIAPIALVAILAMGLGLLPLAPFAAVLGLTVLGFKLADRARENGAKIGLPTALGAASTVLALVGLEVPGVLAQSALGDAVSEDSATADAGIERLRSVTTEGEFRRLISGERPGFLLAGSARNPIGRIGGRERARLYYRLTGSTLFELESSGTWLRLDRPHLSEFGIFTEGLRPRRDGEFTLRGTDVVGPVQRTLALASSRLDGTIDAKAATAYWEWTIEFANAERFRDAEARAAIRLPKDAVVSKLSLWVNGEERPAAFAARGRTEEAYREVAVRQRRDPALITMHGVDQVFLRCSPILPNQLMKVRIGVSAPLVSGEGDDLWSVEAPHFVAHNFVLRTESDVWLDSAERLVATDSALAAEQGAEGRWTARGEVDPDQSFEVQCDHSAREALRWARDYVDASRVIVQELAREPQVPPGRVLVVVDGSRSMRAERERIVALLESLDDSLDPGFCLLDGRGEPTFVGRDEVLDRLAQHDFEGGFDNLGGLERAWDLANEAPGLLVLWIRGTQSVELSNTGGLHQRYARTGGGPVIVELPLVEGEHRTALALSEDLAIPLERAAPGDALAYVSNLHRARERYVRRLRVAEAAPKGALEADSHLVRLWAAQEVRAKAATDPDAMTALAASYRIVTPLTGAVVLETDEQYARFDLDPHADPTAIPTVPEPGEWALLVTAVLVVGWGALRRRRTPEFAA